MGARLLRMTTRADIAADLAAGPAGRMPSERNAQGGAKEPRVLTDDDLAVAGVVRRDVGVKGVASDLADPRRPCGGVPRRPERA